MKLNWERWFYGLSAAIVGGGSGAVTAGLGSIALAPEKFNLTSWSGGMRTLAMMGVTFLINGLLSMFFYLKQSPVPPELTPDVPVKAAEAERPNSK